MIKNYLKTALRNLWKYRGYSLINILGLAIGIACVTLILLYVNSELNIDRFHQKKDYIYRLNLSATNPQTKEVNTRAIGPYRLAKELKVDFPDLEEVIRFAPQGREQVEIDDQIYMEENLTFVDPEVFNVFDYNLIEGDPNNVLSPPFSVVISEDISRKYFGAQNPIGKKLLIRDEIFEVTGLMQNVPNNSQYRFDILVSMNCAPQVFSRIVLENWGEGSSTTFVVVPEDKGPHDYEGRLAAFVDKNLEAWKSFSPKIIMQPLTEVYLYSKDISSFESGGDITYVYAFSLIAIFILIIACINYMNLATARSSVRAEEVGMRKVVGAGRGQLIGQFLSESIVLTILAAIISIGLVFLALPGFNELADRQIEFNMFQNWPLTLGILGVAAIVGALAGSYPALLLSAFDPISVFSGSLKQGFKGGLLRKVLVSFQFATSIFLLIVTGIVYQQLQYCRNMDLGFDKEHLILVPGTPVEMRGQYEQFTSRLQSNPQIVSAAGSSRVPPGRLSSSLRARPEGVPEDEQRGMQTVWTDFDFIETMGFDIAAGRSFQRGISSDATNAFILNEAAVQELGWTNENAIGKTFGSSEIRDWNSGQWENRDGQVIGVLKDFHFESMHEKIVPTVYFVAPYMAWNYVVRVTGEDIPSTIQFIEEVWTNFNPESPFEYRFVDENFTSLYEVEERQGKIFSLFAVLAIFIACLGLIGLASFTADQKRKEIGIRKVLGASSISIVSLLSREFTWLVIVAFILAAPIAWFVMRGWLQDFAYRIPIGVFIFLMAGILSLLIAWLTVGVQTMRAANANPIKSLQQE